MDTSIYLSLPKVELHHHLEGSITPETLHALAKKNLSESPFAQSLETCQQLYSFTKFTGFLRAFNQANSFIQNAKDLDLIIERSVTSLQQENYRYIEYFISIDTFMKKGMSLIEILDRLRFNIKRYSTKKFRIGGFIIDFVRNYGPSNAIIIFNELLSILDDYRDVIIGISIDSGGENEINFPSTVFKDLFETARNAELNTTAHAGEIDHAQSIWDTIFNLKTDRIGHGLHIYESTDLIKHFKVTQTPIEICPTSNLKTGLVTNLKDHPLPMYYTQGLNITINTDDPGFFHTTLSKELEYCTSLFDLDLFEIKQLIMSAAKSCFYNTFDKNELIEELKIDLDKFLEL